MARRTDTRALGGLGHVSGGPFSFLNFASPGFARVKNRRMDAVIKRCVSRRRKRLFAAILGFTLVHADATISWAAEIFVAAGQDTTLTGQVTGTITKTGGGRLFLDAVNDAMTGATVTEGVLLGNTLSIRGDITNNSNVTLFQINNGTYAGTMSGTGFLEVLGPGRVTLSGTNTYSGGTTLNASNIAIANNSVFGTGLVTMSGENNWSVDSPMTITNAINMGSSWTFGGLGINRATLSGDMNLVQKVTILSGQANLTGDIGGEVGGRVLRFADNSSFLLSGNNTYAGGTEVGDKVNLTLGHGNALGSGLVSFGEGLATLSTSVDSLTIANDIQIGPSDQVFFGVLPGLTIFDAVDLTLSGDIQGPGTLTINGSSATLSGTNTHTGETFFSNGVYSIASDASLGAGSNTVNVADAALNFLASTESSRLYDLTGNVLFQAASGADVTLTGIVRSEGGLRIGGEGTINFEGLTAFGSLAIDDGVLRVNDEMTLTGGLTIGTNGALGGSGTIVGNVINNGGTLAVGNSIGDLSQTGNYTQNGGTVEVEIEPGGNTAGTHNDILRVDGDIAISGTTLDVVAADGTYVDGTQYTIFTSTGTISGTGFNTVTDNLTAYDFTTIFNPDSILLQINRVQTEFGLLPGTWNTRRAAAFVDDHLFDLSTTNRNALLTYSATATPAEQQRLLTQVGGAIYASSVTLGVQQTGLAAQTLSNQLVSLDQMSPSCGVGANSGWIGWAGGFGIGGSTQNDGNNGGLDYSVGGVSFGFGKNIAGAGTFGFFGNVADANLSEAYAASSIDQSSTLLGGFARLCGGEGTYLLMAAAGGFDDLDANRSITGINQTTAGQADAGRALVYLENGFDLSGSPGLILQPYYGLQYIHVGLGEFNESGELGLAVTESGHNSLRTILGMRLGESNLLVGGARMNYAIRAAFLYELADQSADMVASLPGPTSTFTQTGFETGRSFGVIGTQIGMDWTDSIRLVANYDLQGNSNQVLHLGGGGIEYAW